MSRRPLAALGAGLLVVVATASLAARVASDDPVASVPLAGATVAPRPGSLPDPADPGRAGDVTWSPGPWGEATVAGHRLLVPSSTEQGPLRDRGEGWASDYAETETGAAIALLRGPWFVFAAPAALRPSVVAAVLAPAAAEEPGPVNPAAGWALPSDLLAGLAAQDLVLLGAVARLTDGRRAEVAVYQQLATDSGPIVIRSTHQLTYTDGQWLIEPSYTDGTGEQIASVDVPAVWTITGPEPRT